MSIGIQGTFHKCSYHCVFKHKGSTFQKTEDKLLLLKRVYSTLWYLHHHYYQNSQVQQPHELPKYMLYLVLLHNQPQVILCDSTAGQVSSIQFLIDKELALHLSSSAKLIPKSIFRDLSSGTVPDTNFLSVWIKSGNIIHTMIWKKEVQYKEWLNSDKSDCEI